MTARQSDVLRFWIMAGTAALAVAPLRVIGDAVPAAPYAIVDRWHLGGNGRWDYLTFDAPRHRLFIARSDRVEIVDAGSGKLIGRIPNTAGVHGVALAPDGRRGYASNGRTNTVTEFEYDTLAVLREVPAEGANPDAIVYEPDSHHLFTLNGTSHDASVYDAYSLKVIAKLALPGKPEYAADDGHGRLYVNIETSPGQLVAIDTRKLTIAATWPLAGCANPSGLALDAEHGRLFSACDNKVMAVTDAKTGRQVTRVPIGEGSDAVVYDAAGGLVLSSNDDGTLTIVRSTSPVNYSDSGTLRTLRGSKTMAFDPKSRRVYLVAATFGAPPPATPEHPHPRPDPLPDSLTLLVAALH